MSVPMFCNELFDFSPVANKLFPADKLLRLIKSRIGILLMKHVTLTPSVTWNIHLALLTYPEEDFLTSIAHFGTEEITPLMERTGIVCLIIQRPDTEGVYMYNFLSYIMLINITTLWLTCRHLLILLLSIE